jgi:hypothetical protein
MEISLQSVCINTGAAELFLQENSGYRGLQR